jgi:hypothetical protein
MRRDLAALGTALLGVGVAVSLFSGLDAGAARVVPPRALTAVAALVALAGVAAVVRSAPGREGPAADTDASTAGPEEAVPLVGERFDGVLADVERMSATRLRRSEEPAYLRERLRQAAVVTVARERGVDHDRAAALVDRGTWTDDPAAAAFLSPGLTAPPRIRLREALSTTPRVVARARRTAAELEGRP